MVIMHHLKIPALRCWIKQVCSAPPSLKAWQLSSQQQRLKATQVNCKYVELKCGDRFKQGPCVSQQADTKLKQLAATALPVQERSIRLKRNNKCCGSPCPDALPRFDMLYYKRTNKFDREYQQTWDECPALVKKPKVVCCSEKIKPAKIKKRSHQQRPLTACHQACAATQAACPYITLKGCRPARHPPRCKPIKVRRQDCKKRPAPSPAFSECTTKLPKIRPVECSCLLTPSICEVWSYYRYLQRIKKIRSC